jgi:hypothetical protein
MKIRQGKKSPESNTERYALLCMKHGAERKRCSSKGCTNKVVRKLYVCEARAKINYAAVSGAQIWLSKEECASGMWQKSNGAGETNENSLKEACGDAKVSYAAKTDEQICKYG